MHKKQEVQKASQMPVSMLTFDYFKMEAWTAKHRTCVGPLATLTVF